jgi:hypothetical protein
MHAYSQCRRQSPPHAGWFNPSRSVDSGNGEHSPASAYDATARFTHDFSRVPVLAQTPPGLQTKLEVGTPGDVYEREADLVSQRVMRMAGPRLQRECACGGSCDDCGKKKDSRLRVQAKSSASGDHGAQAAPASVHNVLRSPGQPLDSSTREFMESRFGHDFSMVRVHTDAQAAESAREVNALAYTVGRDVVFGGGRYAPHAQAGRTLLAHELTHVLQQHGGGSRVMRQSPDGNETAANEDEEERVTPTEPMPQEPGEDAGEAADEGPVEMQDDGKGDKAKAKKKPNCTRTILAEGTCAFLVANSKYICCDPAKGIERKGRTKDIDDAECPSEKFTPIFTCDNKCDKALNKGCDDNDNWMAVPKNQFKRSQCGDVLTICANGKSTTGYVRDHSVTEARFEVSPGIQKALGVTVGSTFKGSVYKPGAKQAAIDKDTCCNS